MTSIDNFPSLRESDRVRSQQVTDSVISAINAKKDGVIGFDEYMRIVLYMPNLGYYNAENEIFGGRGDFVTGPTSGELFSKCVANEVKSILSVTEGDIFEFGAGDGSLINNICKELECHSDSPKFKYHVIEPNKAMRQRQQETIRGRSGQFFWHEKVPEEPLNGVIIANEVLDAMPAARYLVNEGEVEEMGVGYLEPSLLWKKKNGVVPEEIVKALKNYNSGYQTEKILDLDLWLGSVFEWANRIVLLVIDYGYPGKEFLRPDRFSGTLKCHFRHTRNVDPFFLPGLQDITTSVNYSDLARCATDIGFNLLGYTTQERFLVNNKVEAFFSESFNKDSVEQYRIAQEVKRLLLPTEMGHYMKVMALGKNFDGALNGFQSDECFRL